MWIKADRGNQRCNGSSYYESASGGLIQVKAGSIISYYLNNAPLCDQGLPPIVG